MKKVEALLWQRQNKSVNACFKKGKKGNASPVHFVNRLINYCTGGIQRVSLNFSVSSLCLFNR